MIALSDIKKIYFIGIGGIGMSALARYFFARGAIVEGYDKTSTQLTDKLAKDGIPVYFADDATAAPKDVQLVVYTPAIPEQNAQFQFYLQNHYPLLKRSEVLEIISAGSYNVCVAGTHGKTTISTMIAHILRSSGFGCNAFLGGISANYGTNFWSDERNVCVIEADEYDRSFLRLRPDIAVISAVDADHLDIYGTEEALQQAFADFTRKVKPGGLLLTKFGLKQGYEPGGKRHISYSLLNDAADAYAANIRMDHGTYVFDIVMKDNLLSRLVLRMGGMHNVENMVAAATAAHEMGVDNNAISEAIASFKGVQRRFEYIVQTDRITYIDDYAHHPEELKALISSAKTLFRKKTTIIFQPHLFSRTKDFSAGFAASLDMADHVILLPVYPAREAPVEGVTSMLIYERMANENKSLMSREECENYLRNTYLPSLGHGNEAVLITAGAGDIDKMVKPIKEMIEQG